MVLDRVGTIFTLIPVWLGFCPSCAFVPAAEVDIGQPMVVLVSNIARLGKTMGLRE